jgi:hypothetical protein
MTVAIILFALSALIGFALGRLFAWPAIAAASVGLAVLSSAVLQIQGFGAFSGIAIVVICLTLSQVAYLGGGWARHKHLFDKKANRQEQQKAPSQFA